MSSSRKPPPQRSRALPFRTKLMIGLLILAILAFCVMLPWRARKIAETARIESEIAKQQAEANKTAEFLRTLQLHKDSVARNPNDASARMSLAQQLEAAGHLEEALVHVEAARRIAPADINSLRILADLQLRLHCYDSARTSFQKILAAVPDDEHATSGLTTIYLSFGWQTDARLLLNGTLKKHPDNLNLKVTLARTCFQQQDIKTAETLLKQVRATAPDRVELWSSLFDLYMKSRKYKEAIDVGWDALARLPGDARLLNGLAEAYIETDELGRAADLARQALAADPRNAYAHVSLARCYRKQNRLAEAAKELEANLPDFGAVGRTRLLLAELYDQLGRSPEAVALRAQERKSRSTGDLYDRTILYMTMHPNEAAAHWKMAQVYASLQRSARALLEARRSLELGLKDPAARQMVAELSDKGCGQ